MQPAEIETLLQTALELDEVVVRSSGTHYEIFAVGDIFAGKRPVQKQQLVYGPLSEKIADGSLHAVTIKTFTPDEWSLQRKLILPA